MYEGSNFSISSARECYFLNLCILRILEGLNGEGNGNPLQYSCLENPMEGLKWYLFLICVSLSGFHGGSDGKEPACNVGDPGSIPGLAMPWKRKWQPTPVFLPGEFMDRGA